MTVAAPEKFTEQFADWNASVQVDREQRLIRNVALAGQKSSNGYVYSEQALRSAIPLYEGKPVFLDHASNPNRPHDRSTRDLAGSIVNARFESGRPRGDIRAIHSEAGNVLLAMAEMNANDSGMSQVVLAERSKDRKTVTKIHDVVSVDAVVFPATTRNFSERYEGDGTMSEVQTLLERQIATLETERNTLQTDLKSERDKVTALEGEKKTLSEQVGTLTKERDDLKKKVDDFEAERAIAERRSAIAAKLKEYSLNPDDKAQVSDVFMESLLAEPDDKKRDSLIKDRKELVTKAGRTAGVSYERHEPSGGGSTFDPKACFEGSRPFVPIV